MLCEHKNCNNDATHEVRYKYYGIIHIAHTEHFGTVEESHIMCEKCAENLLMNGLANRKEIDFKLIYYVPLDMFD